MEISPGDVLLHKYQEINPEWTILIKEVSGDLAIVRSRATGRIFKLSVRRILEAYVPWKEEPDEMSHAKCEICGTGVLFGSKHPRCVELENRNDR